MWSFIVETWNTFIFEPIFNLIAGLIAFIPGHSFGIALILFVIIVRLVFYPINKKQFVYVKKQKQIQVEVEKIRKKHQGNKQMIAMETLALWREHGFNPFAMLGYLLVQIPIFIALFQVVRKIAEDTANLVEYSYSFLQNTNWMQQLSQNHELFDPSFGLGIFDLTKSATGDGFYLAAFIILIIAVIVQYVVFKQSMVTKPSSRDLPTFRELIRRQSAGEDIDEETIKAVQQKSISRMMTFALPGIIFLFGLGWHSAILFYFMLSSLFHWWQQKRANADLEGVPVEASIDGQSSQAEIEKPLNAKQKKEQSRRQQTSSNSGRKRVQAQAKTVSKTKDKGSKS